MIPGPKSMPGNKGLARELARMNLTLNYYTQWYWKVDLHNLMHFLSLRADAHAQYEIRVYADVMLDVLKRWLPTTYNAFMNYRVGGAALSAKGLKAVRDMLAGNRRDAGIERHEQRRMERTAGGCEGGGVNAPGPRCAG